LKEFGISLATAIEGSVAIAAESIIGTFEHCLIPSR
jgi:hypothetical protein